MNVVVVESPAKAKTINKYLGKDYQVLASYGHVRDLPAKDGSVDPEHDFTMLWQVDDRGEKRIREIAQAVKGAERLYLATDPDREGEAISWHIAEELRRRNLLDDIDVKRVVFNEVTRTAVVQAFENARELNQELIEAYLARRALDYLVGFTLSPVLWRKLPGSRSAGRVQSVVLRMICEREAEIEVFRPREYWTVDATLAAPNGETFTAHLTHLDGRKLDRYDLADEAAARQAAGVLEAAAAFAVSTVERKTVKRNPYPPFTTSTLQQEASHKLGFGATRTMRVAQKLYEGIDVGGETVGLITYMRTDGVQVANEAIHAARNLISDQYGDDYLPSAPRLYKSKAKNAQEAHEAIRPTNLSRRPQDLARRLDPDGLKLYELIWARMLASQMESARLDQMAVDIGADGKRASLRATGSVVVFDGFLTLYKESRKETANGSENGSDRRLPKLNEGDSVQRQAVLPEQHFTQPPPRYSEASMVKKLEEMGIGRPSTYASILQVLQDRDYVRLDKRRFVPEDRGRLVTAFLSSFFPRYVEYNFTADMETQLDDISGGRKDWKAVLRQFWAAFNQAVAGTKDLSITEVIDALDKDLGPHFFPAKPDNPDADPRTCPVCGTGRLGLRLGRSGGFIGCSGYPECRYTRPLEVPGDGEDENAILIEPRVLGRDPVTGEPVTLRKGPFGIYVQCGETPIKTKGKKTKKEKDEDKAKVKPKRCSLPKELRPDDVTLEIALALLALPREIGKHPESGSPITAGIGRYGPYVKHGSTYCSIPADESVLDIGLNRAVTLIAEAPAKRGSTGKAFADHPADGKPITLHSGRYGPYIKHGRTNASLPKGVEPDTLTVERAVELLAARAGKAKGKAKTAKAKKPTKKKTKAKTSKAKTAKSSRRKPAARKAARA
jgi:DNA topoisomerase-1